MSCIGTDIVKSYFKNNDFEIDYAIDNPVEWLIAKIYRFTLRIN